MNEDREALYETLQLFGMTQLHDTVAVHQAWRKKGSPDSKHVEVWASADHMRIDLFILS